MIKKMKKTIYNTNFDFERCMSIFIFVGVYFSVKKKYLILNYVGLIYKILFTIFLQNIVWFNIILFLVLYGIILLYLKKKNFQINISFFFLIKEYFYMHFIIFIGRIIIFLLLKDLIISSNVCWILFILIFLILVYNIFFSKKKFIKSILNFFYSWLLFSSIMFLQFFICSSFLAPDSFIISALTFKFFFLTNIIIFPFHYFSFLNYVSTIENFFINNNIIFYNNNKLAIGKIWEEWMKETNFSFLKEKYSDYMDNLYNNLKEAKVLDLELTVPQQRVFLSFCKLCIIPDYDNQDWFIFGEKKMSGSRHIVLHKPSAFIKNLSSELSIFVFKTHIAEERIQISRETFEPILKNVLMEKVGELDNIVALCKTHQDKTIDEIDVYIRVNTIQTEPTYTEIWRQNRFIYVVGQVGDLAQPYRPWSPVHLGREIEFKLNGQRFRLPSFRTLDNLLETYNNTNGIRKSKYFYVGENVRILKVSE